MKIHHRAYNYESDDFTKLCRFIIQDNSRKQENFNGSLGRIVELCYQIFKE